MRYFSLYFLAAICTTSTIASKIPFTGNYLSHDQSDDHIVSQQVGRPCKDNLEAHQKTEAETALETDDIEWGIPTPEELSVNAILGNKKLGKRRGGGGGKGGGSSGSSGSSGSKGGGTSSSAGRSGSTSSTSSARPTYGGGKYYYGGATTPYSAGSRSPRGLTPYFLGGAALGFFPGLALYGAYAYPYSHPYGFYNRTSNTNETLPVQCLCDAYSACGCDDNQNTTYISDLLGNGSVAGQNGTLIKVATVNGTKTVFLNGTLPNGTDDSTSAAIRTAGRSLVEGSGYWLMVAVVGATVWAL